MGLCPDGTVLKKVTGFDVYHITGDIHFLAWACPPKKTILTIHDCGFLNHANPFLRIVYKYFWLNGPVNRVSVVTCVSEATRQDIIKYSSVPPEKVVVVPTIIDERWVKSPKEFNEICPIILQIGTKPNKNVPRLIQALAGFRVKLWVVGELDRVQEALLEKYEIDYENFYNLSFDRLQELYRQCDMVAFCSTFEGFGMPIVEGNSTGRVVLTSNCSSMPEIAGNAAHLIDPFSVASIREGVKRIASDRAYRERLIEAGYENVKRYSAKSVADDYCVVYRKVYESNN